MNFVSLIEMESSSNNPARAEEAYNVNEKRNE